MEKSTSTHNAISQSHSAISQSNVSIQSETTFLEARLTWVQLYSEPDCLINPQKRLAMLSARLQYQQAKLDWFFRLRASSSLQKLYASVIYKVEAEGFLGVTVADVADVHDKLNMGSSPNGLIGWAIAGHLREHLHAETTGDVL